MFFFISGYVGYRERNDWNLFFVSSFLKKKIKTILIPTISAISLYILCVNAKVDDMLFSSSKGGGTGLPLFCSRCRSSIVL